MVVLGIDPGITNMGLGVVEQQGKKARLLFADVIKTKHADPAPLRVGLIYKAVSHAVMTYKPEAIAVEDQFFYRQNELAYKVGWAMGAVLVVAAEHGLEVYGYGPPKVKQTLVGHGRAEKDQVAYMVQAVLELPRAPSPSHLADAIAIALTHCFHSGRALPAPF